MRNYFMTYYASPLKVHPFYPTPLNRARRDEENDIHILLPSFTSWRAGTVVGLQTPMPARNKVSIDMSDTFQSLPFSNRLTLVWHASAVVS